MVEDSLAPSTTVARATLHLVRILFALAALACSGQARADYCTATMTDIAFGNVSPVAGRDYYASGTLTVTCTAVLLQGNLALLPVINACASLGPGPGATDVYARVLANGARRIRFNLYRAQTYDAANTWAGYDTASSINAAFGGLLAIGSASLSYPVYARIAAADLASATAGSAGGDTYAASFAGAGTVAYSSSTLISPACQSSGLSAPFGFNVTANVLNDCVITAAPVAFGTRGILSGAARATGTLSVRCTSGSPYRIALDGGTVAGTPAARRMKDTVSGATVAYRLSPTLDGAVWGDGNAGTVTVDGTGTGTTQALTVYGLVPGQTTPPPGDYSDRVTATVYF